MICEPSRPGKLHPDEEEFPRLPVFISIIPDVNKEMQTYILGVDKSIKQNVKIHHIDGRLSDEVSVKFDYLIEDGGCQRNCDTFSPCFVRECESIITGF